MKALIVEDARVSPRVVNTLLGKAYYAATKAAVVAYTKGWARDLTP